MKSRTALCALLVGLCSTAPPAGAAGAGGYDDFTCRPSSVHPTPVVLVHGAGIAGVSDMSATWGYDGPSLARAGYCVFALNYGKYRGIWGRARVAPDAAELSTYIGHVMDATRSRRVSIVSHSAGGIVVRYYLKFLGGAALVDDFVELAGPNHVTTLKHRCPLLCTQLNRGAIMRRLNRGGELQPGVDYTIVESEYDDAIVPYTAAFLHGSRQHLTNVLLQRRCPMNRTNHGGLLIDPVVLQWVENALAVDGPACRNFRPQC